MNSEEIRKDYEKRLERLQEGEMASNVVSQGNELRSNLKNSNKKAIVPNGEIASAYQQKLKILQEGQTRPNAV